MCRVEVLKRERQADDDEQMEAMFLCLQLKKTQQVSSKFGDRGHIHRNITVNFLSPK